MSIRPGLICISIMISLNIDHSNLASFNCLNCRPNLINMNLNWYLGLVICFYFVGKKEDLRRRGCEYGIGEGDP